VTAPIILGGGIAGAAAACRLARAGHQVTLIERHATPTDKICGEFLSREAQLHLRGLGLDLAALGGQRITHLRLVRDTEAVRVALPFTALGLSRRVLDEALLQQASAAGAVILRGQPARLEAGKLVLSGRQLPGDGPLLLATGKHEMAALPRGQPGDLVGFKTYFNLAPSQAQAVAGHIEVVLFADGYAGLQAVEGGRFNLCLLVRRDRLAQVGLSWELLLEDLCRTSTHLRTRLEGAVPGLAKPLAIYRVPYGFLYRGKDDLFRLGDQMGVIDSFSGDGMSIALHSAALAARAVCQGVTAEAYHRQMRRDIGGQIRRARWLYRVGQHRLGQTMLMRLAQAWPPSLRLATIMTRVPERALAEGLAWA